MGILDGIVEMFGGGVTGGNILSLGGSLLSGWLGADAQRDTNQANLDINSANNAFNAQQAEITRNWQHDMRGSQYQQAVDDMKKAGLNPMLAYQQGGAGNLSGATASASSPIPMQNIRTAGMNAAAQAAGIQATLTQSDVNRATVKQKEAETVQSLASAGHLDAVRDNIRQEMTAFPERVKKLIAETGAMDAQALRDASQTDLNEYAFKYLNPATLNRLRAEVTKLTNEGRLLGLKIPEATREFEFFSDPTTGRRAIGQRHAVGGSKLGGYLFNEAGDSLGNAADYIGEKATSAFDAARSFATRRRGLQMDRFTGQVPPW